MLGSQSWPRSHRSPPIAGKSQDQKNTVIKGTSFYHQCINIRKIFNKDMDVKKARYITKNIKLNQKLFFASFFSKIFLNKTYNHSFYGSTLWNHFNEDFIRIESAYNQSIKIMGDLEHATHRCLIPVISQQRHLRITLL